MDMDMHRDKVRKLEQELAELTAAEIDEKEVTYCRLVMPASCCAVY